MNPEISIKFALKPIDCSPEGKKVCKGKCCTTSLAKPREEWVDILGLTP